MQIVDDGATAEIEEVFAHSPIASAATLPLTHMSQGMLDSHSFAQFAPSLCGLLALAQLDEQGFIGMNTHTASIRTGGTLLFQWALSAGFFRKVDNPARHKGHLLFSRAPDDLPFPI
jgi:hypothetical protein